MSAPLVVDRVPLGAAAATPLTLEVPARHSVGLLGDELSGVGALARYALGLERPRSGQVRLFDVAIAELPEAERFGWRRRAGYLPAGNGLLQNLSLRDNVALPLRFGSDASTRELEGRVNVLLAAVRVTEVADRRPAEVNEEQRRRAAFARAMAFDPSLLLLERPFDALTARASTELLEFARGGETAEGARRAILITGPELPGVIRRRIEAVYRLTRAGTLELEPALAS